MERIEYDPEIDSSIREEREAAERERELSARIRLEIERYVADNELVPRDRAQEQKQDEPAEKPETKALKPGRRSRKAVQSIFTGSILSSEWVRKMWPYLLGIAAVLTLYIACSFHIQTLHLERGRLEREVRELGIEAVERTAERVRRTRRSAIVERLAEKGIPLEEFPHPVKTIER